MFQREPIRRSVGLDRARRHQAPAQSATVEVASAMPSRAYTTTTRGWRLAEGISRSIELDVVRGGTP